MLNYHKLVFIYFNNYLKNTQQSSYAKAYTQRTNLYHGQYEPALVSRPMVCYIMSNTTAARHKYVKQTTNTTRQFRLDFYKQYYSDVKSLFCRHILLSLSPWSVGDESVCCFFFFLNFKNDRYVKFTCCNNQRLCILYIINCYYFYIMFC